MAKAEKILLATDGSEFIKEAVGETVRLAKQCSSKLFVVSVVETNPEYAAIAPQLVEKAEKETRQHLESVRDIASREGVDCKIIARRGEEPYKHIIEEAARNNVDMIIMGRRGRTGLKRLMMGSVTAKVIGRAACNVLVVPRAAKLEFKNIVIATDGSRYSDAAASEAISIAKQCAANLIIISVIYPESMSPMNIILTRLRPRLVAEKELKKAEKNITKIKELAKKEGVNPSKITGLILIGSPNGAIINTAEDKKAELIVVGRRGRTGLSRLLTGSVTERVIGHAECAVLVVKSGN